MNTSDMLEEIRRWVEIETKTGHVNPINRLSRIIENECTALGCGTRRIQGQDGQGDHLMVESPGAAGPGVLILSHIDTVHPPGTLAGELPFSIEGDKAFGPGIYDMKAGAFLVMASIRNILTKNIVTSLPFRWLIVSDEEVGSPTSREHIVKAGDDARYVLVSEPARDGGKVVTSRKGSARFRIVFRGIPAHSGSRHQDGRSAIKEMAHKILALEAMTDYELGVTTNCGIVQGGSGVNVIPEHAELHFDMRLPTQALGDRLVSEVQNLQSHDPDVGIEVFGGMSRPPFPETAATMALFDRAKEIAAGIGFDLVGTATGGGSDGNFLADRLPVLDGLGADGAGAHTLDEHILISSLEPRQQLMQRLISVLV